MVRNCAPSINDSQRNLLNGRDSMVEGISEIDIDAVVCTGLAM